MTLYVAYSAIYDRLYFHFSLFRMFWSVNFDTKWLVTVYAILVFLYMPTVSLKLAYYEIVLIITYVELK